MLWKILAAAAGIVVLVAGLLLTIVYVPQLAIDPRGLSRTDWLKAVRDLRTTILQGLGGLALLGTLYFSSRTLQLNRRGQLIERFTKSVEQLGKPVPEQLAVRLGGIYALQQIALDSEEVHWPVMEVLSACLQESSRTATFQGLRPESVPYPRREPRRGQHPPRPSSWPGSNGHVRLRLF